MPLLEIDHVSFAFGARSVLDDVSLVVERGSLVALVGPNGAGKTTLLRVASGLYRPARGRVTVEGERLEGLPRARAARLVSGVSAEEEAQFPFTVRESVALGRLPWLGAFRRPSSEEEARVEDVLAATGLDTFAERLLSTLSSGERQRVAIARCLVQAAPVLLLDEPTSHLDLGQRVRMLDLIVERARAEGLGILAVLHDLNLAAHVADRVGLLVRGRLEAFGAPVDVLTSARLQGAFGTGVSVMRHPMHGTPVVLPDGGEG